MGGWHSLGYALGGLNWSLHANHQSQCSGCDGHFVSVSPLQGSRVLPAGTVCGPKSPTQRNPAPGVIFRPCWDILLLISSDEKTHKPSCFLPPCSLPGLHQPPPFLRTHTPPPPSLEVGLAAKFVPCVHTQMDIFSKLGHSESLSWKMELGLGESGSVLLLL